MNEFSPITNIIFMLTTFLTVGIFLFAVRRSASDMLGGKLLIAIVPAWMLFHTVLAMGGFHQHFGSLPPRLLIFGPLPAFLFVIAFLSFGRETVARLPLTILTLIHVIRIPVEFVLHSLYHEGGIPREMTFEGWNFDIATGITAPIAYLLAFGKEGVNKQLLIGWNLAGLFLLAVIVVTAIFAFPFPFQRLGFEQPNVAVAFFPYIWLPTVIVPIVLFCHLASLYKIATNKTN